MTKLSRRNLLLLLYKVQIFGYGFIQRDGSCIKAESDGEPALSSDPACEKFIAEMEKLLG